MSDNRDSCLKKRRVDSLDPKNQKIGRRDTQNHQVGFRSHLLYHQDICLSWDCVTAFAQSQAIDELVAATKLAAIELDKKSSREVVI